MTQVVRFGTRRRISGIAAAVAAVVLSTAVAVLLLLAEPGARGPDAVAAGTVAAGDATPAGLDGVADGRPGDPRIHWVALETSAVAPLVADGEAAWVAVVESPGGDGRSGSSVYRLEPATGRVVRVAELSGTATAAALVEPGVAAFALEGRIALVSADGSVVEVPIPGLAPVAGAEGAPVTGLAALNGRLYAVSETSQQVHEIDPVTRETRVLPLPADVAPPASIAATPGGRLVLSTPYRVGDLDPASALMDPATGEVEVIDLRRAYAVAVHRDGRLVATQSRPGGGIVAREPGAAGSEEVPGSIPWTGKFDLLALVEGEGLWGAPYQGGAIYFERNSPGETVTLPLPAFRVTTSVPWGSKAPGVAIAEVTISSMVALDDETLVFVATSPGGSLGWIRLP